MRTLIIKLFKSSAIINFYKFNACSAAVCQNYYYNTVKFKHYFHTNNLNLSKNIEALQQTTESNVSQTDVSVQNLQQSAVSNQQSELPLLFQKENQDMSDIAPNIEPTLTFAKYINKSPILQQFLKLGVNLHTLEKKKEVAEFLLKLKFEEDVKPYIIFLHDVGVPADKLGVFITKNPLIFKESIEDLKVRINYLSSKKFSKNMIANIVSKNPHWLSFSVERIDSRLGFFQKTYDLSGDQVRSLASESPMLITTKLSHVKLVTFVIKEEMGFENHEVKKLLLTRPKIFRLSQLSLLPRFEYVHNVMKVPHQQLLDQPSILLLRAFKIKQRHLFLQSLGRAQYNPNLPGFIPLDDITFGSDSEFCEKVAKSSVQTFNTFLKSEGL